MRKLIVGTAIIISSLGVASLVSADNHEGHSVMEKRNMSGAVGIFHTENSGAIRDAVKSLTGTQRVALKDSRKSILDLRRSLTGMTVEQKLSMTGAMEDAIRKNIETKFQTNSGLLEKRIEIYEINKSRRAEAAAKMLENLIKRSTDKLESINTIVTKIEEKLPELNALQKEKVAKRIEERINKINSNKKITEASKAEIIKKLNNLLILVRA